MTFIQIAVALASIAALTSKRWLLLGSVSAAVGGIGLAVSSWLL